ncbi:uncharacterized protein LOC121589202 [Anopheles merus]|uniref:uncharacterized protein LOC121589202 n=1 Tax=Anopheles merus TaxID=30066 RepID=UPI001BE4B9EB|nr:uncharacterized protein LOC121589202 [Anopheles merus]
MGTELNNALKFLVTPKRPEEIPYEELQKTLKNHFDQKKNKFVESVKFRNILQQRGETISQFVLRLKQGAAYCEYDDFLDRMLIEQMLHGMEARDICDEIIAKNPSTFKEAFDIALTLEATRNTVRDISTATPSASAEATNKLGYENPQTTKQQPFRRAEPPTKTFASHSRWTHEQSNNTAATPCNGCGGPHPRSLCRFRNALCHTCNKKGHLSQVCRAGNTPRKRSNIDQVADFNIDPVLSINTIRNSAPAAKLMIDIKIDGKRTSMELDTGAPCGIMGETTLRSLKTNYSFLPTGRQFTSYTGHRIHCLGRLPVNVSVGTVTRRLNLYIVAGQTDALFGREWIAQFVDQIDLGKMIAPNTHVNAVTSSKLTIEHETQFNSLLDSFRSVFSDVPGKLTGPPASVHLKPDATPIFAKARDVPLALRDKYAAEIEKNSNQGFTKRWNFPSGLRRPTLWLRKMVISELLATISPQ